MHIGAQEFSRYARRQTAIAIAVCAVFGGTGFALLTMINVPQGHWLLGFGVGFVACRAVHSIAEQRYAARQRREAAAERDWWRSHLW